MRISQTASEYAKRKSNHYGIWTFYYNGEEEMMGSGGIGSEKIS
ncbi:hypothetical protein [Desulfosporosinus burensis]